MKIYKKIVLDKNDNIIEEHSYDYEGPIAQAGGGSKIIKAIIVIAVVVVAVVVLGPSIGTIFQGVNMNSWFMKALVSVGTSMIAGAIGMKLAPKMDPPDFGTTLQQGITVSTKSPTAPYRITYGQARIGGTIVYAETTSSTNEYLHMVVVFAGHELDEIGSIYFNDDVVDLETTSNDSNGIAIYTPKSSDQYYEKAQIKKHLGNADQLADANLVADVTQWTSNHKISGKAYVYARFKFD